METFVFTELIKLRALTARGFRLHHYRDRDGREIDFVCEGPGRRDPNSYRSTVLITVLL